MAANLYIMVGCPGSGKTTFIRRHFRNTAVVSRDNIRFRILAENNSSDYFAYENQVYDEYVNKIIEYLSYDKDVVADATHLTKASRKKLTDALTAKAGAWYNVVYIYMNTGLEECLERNSKRYGLARVPDESVKKMFKKLEKPTKNEHIWVDSIWVIS